MKLVLFDIDGTLAASGHAHKDSFSEAFKKVYGVATDISIIKSAGMTDQQIITEVLKKEGFKNENKINA